MSEPNKLSENEMEEILKRLAWARKQAGLTQSQAAQQLGVSSRTINHWESKSKRYPPLNNFIQMCDLYDVNVVWVITGTNPWFDPATIMEMAEKTCLAREDLDKMLDLLESTAKAEDLSHV